MLKEAKVCHAMGDEELAYVYYMKYFGLISVVKGHREFQKHKSFVMNVIGSNSEWKRIMDITADLKDRLKDRYRERDQKEKKTKSVDQKMKETTIEDKDDPIEQKITISCEELMILMMNKSSTILIIDCRPKDEYRQSRLEYESHLNIPGENIRKG